MVNYKNYQNRYIGKNGSNTLRKKSYAYEEQIDRTKKESIFKSI